MTTLIRALGVGTNAEIIDLFGEEPKLISTFEKDESTDTVTGLKKLYEKIRPGEPVSVESAESLISGMFFDPKRYDIAKADATSTIRSFCSATGLPAMSSRRMWWMRQRARSLLKPAQR